MYKGCKGVASGSIVAVRETDRCGPGQGPILRGKESLTDIAKGLTSKVRYIGREDGLPAVLRAGIGTSVSEAGVQKRTVLVRDILPVGASRLSILNLRGVSEKRIIYSSFEDENARA